MTITTIHNLKGGNAKQRRKVRRLFAKFGPNVLTERSIRWYGDYFADGAYHVR